jgi:hypothetical protein
MVIVSPMFDVAQLRDPLLLARFGVECNGAIVERVEHEQPVLVGRAAVHDIAARHTLRGRQRLRLVLPLERRTRLGQVEREDDVRKRGDDVHGVVHHDRSGLMPSRQAGGECHLHAELLDALACDLIERAEPRACKVLGRTNPVA